MKSLIFRFPMSREQSIQLLEQTKQQEDYFRTVIAKSQEMKKFVNEDDLPSIKDFFEKNITFIPFLRVFIDEAFEQAVLYRYFEVVQYFINNSNLSQKKGYQIQNPTIFGSLIQTSRFLRHDPPTELLEILLEAGVSPDQNCDAKYRTPLHLACKYGIVQFIEILIAKGSDLNAVDQKKQTPMMYLERAMKKYPLKEVHELMKQKGAKNYVDMN